MSRLLAAWLIVAVALPFTAPFSTCDVAALAGLAHDAAGTGGDASTAVDESAPTVIAPADHSVTLRRLVAALDSSLSVQVRVRPRLYPTDRRPRVAPSTRRSTSLRI